MKTLRLIALSAILAVASVSAILYTSSCSKDECKNVSCHNGGTCNGGTCVCPVGYMGTNCDTRALVGRWTGSDVCTPSNTSGTIIIELTNNSTDSAKIVINNAGGYLGTFNGNLSADGTRIDYSNQVVSNTSLGITYYDTLSGNIVLTNNTTFVHTYTDQQGTSYSCHGTYTKL